MERRASLDPSHRHNHLHLRGAASGEGEIFDDHFHRHAERKSNFQKDDNFFLQIKFVSSAFHHNDFVLWLAPDISNATVSVEATCMVQSSSERSLCKLGNFSQAVMYNIIVNASSSGPVAARIRACRLTAPTPGSSVWCWVNPKQGEAFQTKPEFPTGLTVGVGILGLLTILTGVMTVRSFIMWKLKPTPTRQLELHSVSREEGQP